MNKEESILELFLNEPAKQWHFEEILKSKDKQTAGNALAEKVYKRESD